jgi:hypothetical protein
MHTTNRKILIVLIFVILGSVVGIGMFNARAQTKPQEVVERFYGSWVDALTSATGPLEQGLHRKSTYVTEGFGREVERANERGRDSVLCTGTRPNDFSVSNVRISGEGARASADFRADSVTGHVILEKDTLGWWRISEVDCPPAELDFTTSTTTAPGTDTVE